jgi:hypothetical protein
MKNTVKPEAGTELAGGGPVQNAHSFKFAYFQDDCATGMSLHLVYQQ